MKAEKTFYAVMAVLLAAGCAQGTAAAKTEETEQTEVTAETQETAEETPELTEYSDAEDGGHAIEADGEIASYT